MMLIGTKKKPLPKSRSYLRWLSSPPLSRSDPSREALQMVGKELQILIVF